jgi:hypothetical protein
MKPLAKAPVGTALIVAGIIIVGLYWLAHQYGLWLPDVVLPKRTLARYETPDGHRFRVVQHMGDAEWYHTELVHTFPSGKSETHLLAFEDDFAWRVPMSVSESQRVVSVQVGSGSYRRVEW